MTGTECLLKKKAAGSTDKILKPSQTTDIVEDTKRLLTVDNKAPSDKIKFISNATNNAMYMSTSQYNTMRNMQYETYFGSKVTGTNVRALIQKVLTNNRQAVTNDEELGNMIYVRLDGKDITNYSDIKSGKNYSVNSSNNNKANDETKFGAEYWTNGFLKSIEITTLN